MMNLFGAKIGIIQWGKPEVPATTDLIWAVEDKGHILFIRTWLDCGGSGGHHGGPVVTT